jgi:two-component system response regulator NreC
MATDDEPITIVLADDHAVVRSGLRMVLERADGFEVVSEADDADAALRTVLGHKPTILVPDLNMPGELTSLDPIPRVHEPSPHTRVVVLTMQQDRESARRALRTGAAGYVLKEAADDELVDAVRSVAEGGTYLNPRLGAILAAAPPEPSGPPDDLTEREVDVLRLIALGHTNAEIAGELFLSVRTVESHRAHIQQKPRRTTRAELVRYALDHGFVDAQVARSGQRQPRADHGPCAWAGTHAELTAGDEDGREHHIAVDLAASAAIRAGVPMQLWQSRSVRAASTEVQAPRARHAAASDTPCVLRAHSFRRPPSKIRGAAPRLARHSWRCAASPIRTDSVAARPTSAASFTPCAACSTVIRSRPADRQAAGRPARDGRRGD